MNRIKVRRGWNDDDGITEDEVRIGAVWVHVLAVNVQFLHQVLWVEAELPKPHRSENI